jgi:hypothetical protein
MLADAIGLGNKRAAGSFGPSVFGAAPPQSYHDISSPEPRNFAGVSL